jgi:ABC-2 type transport system ATP-binding protein
MSLGTPGSPPISQAPPRNEGEDVITVRGLVKRYGDLEAVQGIDLGVRRGEIFGFLGPNGAGKTTTISVLCTLAEASAGTAIVAGCDVATDADEVRARIGLVFQDPSLDDQLTARENLRFTRGSTGFPARHGASASTAVWRPLAWRIEPKRR